tara:strand:+ start:10906 stop:12054 length:1149 start_codon:yes stop_codon:yes gene_type:complete
MKKIYLDNNSTTQIDPIVLENMLPFFNIKYGNSSSQSHAFGWEAKAAIDIAREQIANLINAENDEIIFTSGATESNNLAINGLISYKHRESKKSNIITSTIEHKAVLDVCKKVSINGCKTIYVKPNNEGIINIEKIKNLIHENITLISIMHANNEIGTIQPIKEIGKLCEDNNIILHVDAAQSLGKIKIDVKNMKIDMLSISSHKIYGPKGVGALYIKNKKRKTKLEPIIVGGGQENNLRSGTLPTPLIVGFGKACELAFNKIQSDNQRIQKLSNKLINNILDVYPNIKLNGSREHRIPGNINLSFPFLKGLSIINSMPEIAISSGSACTSSSPAPSHVLNEIGISKIDSNTSIRIGIGRFNTDKDIEIASNSIINAIRKKI